MSKKILVFYKSTPLEKLKRNLSNENIYLPLFSDKECTKQIGYNYIESIRNVLETINVKYMLNKTLFIKDDIIKISYVKNNDDIISTPIIFYNKWENKSKELGYVQRQILKDGITRRLVISLNN